MVIERRFVIYIHNMRNGKLTAEEVAKAEMAKENRLQSRKKGFAKMHERDEGMARLSNGVLIQWPVVEPEYPDKGIHTYPARVPEGHFVLKVGEESVLFDAEEFRRHLRWV